MNGQKGSDGKYCLPARFTYQRISKVDLVQMEIELMQV